MKVKKTKEYDLLRKKKHTILFNNREMEAINAYCKKYKIENKSRFMRETIITEILKRFEEDHPTLFEVNEPNLFSK